MSTQKRLRNDEPKQDVLAEARMVLPGIQALFGFQFIAVFNQRFAQLSEIDKAVHIAALMLVALAAGLTMAPAAIDRFVEGQRGERHLRRWAPALLGAGMFLLLLGITAELFIVTKLAFNATVATWMATVGGVLLAVLWFGLPLFLRTRK